MSSKFNFCLCQCPYIADGEKALNAHLFNEHSLGSLCSEVSNAYLLLVHCANSFHIFVFLDTRLRQGIRYYTVQCSWCPDVVVEKFILPYFPQFIGISMYHLNFSSNVHYLYVGFMYFVTDFPSVVECWMLLRMLLTVFSTIPYSSLFSYHLHYLSITFWISY